MGRFQKWFCRAALVVIAEADVVASTNLAYAISLILAATVRAESLVGNVDALYENNQTIGNFVGNVRIKLLILGLISGLQITACVIPVSPVVRHTSLKTVLVVKQDEVTCIGQARQCKLALVQLVIVNGRTICDCHVRNEA